MEIQRESVSIARSSSSSSSSSRVAIAAPAAASGVTAAAAVQEHIIAVTAAPSAPTPKRQSFTDPALTRSMIRLEPGVLTSRSVTQLKNQPFSCMWCDEPFVGGNMLLDLYQTEGTCKSKVTMSSGEQVFNNVIMRAFHVGGAQNCSERASDNALLEILKRVRCVGISHVAAGYVSEHHNWAVVWLSWFDQFLFHHRKEGTSDSSELLLACTKPNLCDTASGIPPSFRLRVEKFWHLNETGHDEESPLLIQLELIDSVAFLTSMLTRVTVYCIDYEGSYQPDVRIANRLQEWTGDREDACSTVMMHHMPPAIGRDYTRGVCQLRVVVVTKPSDFLILEFMNELKAGGVAQPCRSVFAFINSITESEHELTSTDDHSHLSARARKRHSLCVRMRKMFDAEKAAFKHMINGAFTKECTFTVSELSSFMVSRFSIDDDVDDKRSVYTMCINCQSFKGDGVFYVLSKEASNSNNAQLQDAYAYQRKRSFYSSSDNEINDMLPVMIALKSNSVQHVIDSQIASDRGLVAVKLDRLSIKPLF
jgi:hypothetical protein